ncbi:MAG: flagellar biosynthesis protein [Gammaproteobacteria bacterium]|nr:flagellar biosynthesis protein [Gammaproteobacteria bacterium]MDH3431007.1 flagellar biosynthesis protein [Gammaproteobacteria bacterium]
MKKSYCGAFLLALAFAVSGCATTRGVLEVAEEESVNPESGQAVRIVQVVDARQFQIDPPQADIPSLKNNEIDDPGITSRAIARKRNSFGKAMGDILLPEGQTVMDLVSSSLAKGLRENGFRVVSEPDADFTSAVPLEVEIEKFWGWFQPGFWQLKLHYVTAINVSGPTAIFTDGESFASDVEMGFQVASSSNWLETIDASLAELNREISARLAEYRKSNPD